MQTYYGKINRIEKVNDRQNKCIFGRKGPASRKGTRMNDGGLNLVKFFLCGVYLSHLLERPAFDQRSLKLVIVPFTKKPSNSAMVAHWSSACGLKRLQNYML